MSKRQIHLTVACKTTDQRDSLQKLILEVKLFSKNKLTAPQALTFALMRYADFLKSKSEALNGVEVQADQTAEGQGQVHGVPVVRSAVGR